jgi:hypothetical protein
MNGKSLRCIVFGIRKDGFAVVSIVLGDQKGLIRMNRYPITIENDKENGNFGWSCGSTRMRKALICKISREPL